MENLPTSSGISAQSALRNNYFDGSVADKIDPLYQLVFSRPNGVLQESKLATYMASGTSLGSSQGLSKGLASLNLDGGTSKKVLGSEYIPNSGQTSSSSPSFLGSYAAALTGSPVQNHGAYNAAVTGSPVPPTVYGRDGSPSLVAPAPQRITPRTSPPLDCISPNVLEKPLATYQENVGGTTYFYPAAAATATSSSPATLIPEPTPSPIVMPSYYSCSRK
jgi:hypothetical protein